LRGLKDIPILPVGSHTDTQDPGKAMHTADTPDRIIRIKAVLERTGLSRSTLYRKVQDGTFPRQLKLSERCAGWRESSINAWLRNPMFYSVEDHPGA
jgi:prophage regulatory protein